MKNMNWLIDWLITFSLYSGSSPAIHRRGRHSRRGQRCLRVPGLAGRKLGGRPTHPRRPGRQKHRPLPLDAFLRQRCPLPSTEDHFPPLRAESAPASLPLRRTQCHLRFSAGIYRGKSAGASWGQLDYHGGRSTDLGQADRVGPEGGSGLSQSGWLFCQLSTTHGTTAGHDHTGRKITRRRTAQFTFRHCCCLFSLFVLIWFFPSSDQCSLLLLNSFCGLIEFKFFFHFFFFHFFSSIFFFFSKLWFALILIARPGLCRRLFSTILCNQPTVPR